MRLYKPKQPKRPELPDVFKSHPELFRSYNRRLRDYYLWRSQAYTTMFSEGMGAFTHLFLIAGDDIHHLGFLLGCYHLGIDGSSFTRRDLAKIVPLGVDALHNRRRSAIKQGYIRIFKRGRYVITPEGIEYVEEQGREFYRRLLKLYDIM